MATKHIRKYSSQSNTESGSAAELGSVCPDPPLDRSPVRALNGQLQPCRTSTEVNTPVLRDFVNFLIEGEMRLPEL